MQSIRGIRKIRGTGDIPDLSKAKARGPVEVTAGIPRALGRKEDPLEKAALQGVPGTLPERIVWKWLEDEDHQFTVQMSEGGGRLSIGGAVVDFVVYTLAAVPVAMRVQGDYWHGPNFPDRQRRDDEQASRLRQWGYIVADLWESDIYEAVLHGNLEDYIMDQIVA